MTNLPHDPPPDTLPLLIDTLGPREEPSPLTWNTTVGDEIANFVEDDARLIMDPTLARVRAHFAAGREPPSLELAGPRARIFFKPGQLTAAVVTCGGLCPGLNNVIRALVMQLWYGYGVRRILGVRFGFQGLIPGYGYAPRKLTPEAVADIHEQGGSLLGTSRGQQDVAAMVDTLVHWGVGVLFVVGGDGTLRGAHAITQEVARRRLGIAVVGVPKTIDNDIFMVSRSFGFDTAVEQATVAIRAAHAEARGVAGGVGLVKLMGRHAGFIACSATLAMREVNLVLIPEARFELRGRRGVLALLEERLDRRGHAVVVVAEGAGQDLMAGTRASDASGNAKLADIGPFLAARIQAYFQRRRKPISLKYIDPSYIIRAAPANSRDADFCGSLAEHAVHAGLAGKTGLVVGYWGHRFTHVPLATVALRQKRVEIESDLWRSTLASTGQPPVLHA